ncbi:phosphatase PAP2 family protein [uncultured Cohaesibacter sp.]|uniref:phosphatase PAP2 family protein n=1 Tax=uncultured Cohaesibacter sp. TaxID=1002546 RepID=UPI00292E89F6|nr:phosphatase PAP2 family protein [uncultured Cohaesibacter sp.]
MVQTKQKHGNGQIVTMSNILKLTANKTLLSRAALILSLTSAIFLIAPEIDIWFSRLFYSPADGFWLKDDTFPTRLRALGLFLPRVIIICLLLFSLARLLWPKLRSIFPLTKIIYLIGTATIGPGLLVNGILKANWGRARPVQTDLFGGHWPYSEVWVIANNCKSNCSFVSGEASMAFWLIGLVILLPMGWRKVGLWIIASLTSLVSLNRIAFGAHYLSDILIGWSLTGLVMALMLLLFDKLGLFSERSDKIEKYWDKSGLWLRTRGKMLLSRLLNRDN